MHTRIIATITALSALAIGCGAFAQAIQPGKWGITTKILSMQIKGMPPSMATAMHEPTTDETCVTPAKANEGFRAAMKNDADCNTKTVKIRGGVLDAVSVCKDNTMQLHGSFSPTA